MPQLPTITYAPPHAAISAMIGVVATSPDGNFVKGSIRTLSAEDEFVVAAGTPQPTYPNPTKWTATGDASIIVAIGPDLKAALETVWGYKNWLHVGYDLVWVPAVPVSAAEREQLVGAYCGEFRIRPEVAAEHFSTIWLALRERFM